MNIVNTANAFELKCLLEALINQSNAEPFFSMTPAYTQISDVSSQNQDFLKWHNLALKFNLNVPFTTCYALVNAIPKHWKANLKDPIANVTNDTTVNTLRTSLIYSSLLNTIFVPPTSLPKPKFYATDLQKKNIQKVFISCHFQS